MPFDGFKFNTQILGKQKKYILNKLPYAIDTTPFGNSWQKVVFNDRNNEENLIVEDGLQFQINKDWLNVRGCLPKIVNGNNNEDLTVKCIKYAFEVIEEVFNIGISFFKVGNIEIGASLKNPPLSSLEIAKHLVSYQNEPFVDLPKLSGINASYGKHCELNQMIFKGYSKSLQNNLLNDVFRFELKTKKMQFLQAKSKASIVTPEDLLKEEVLLMVANLVPKVYKTILKTEPIVEANLSPKERLLFLQGKNPSFFKEHLLKVSKSTYNRNKKKFKGLFTYELQNQIESLLREKMLYLISKSEYNITYPSGNTQKEEMNTILPFSLKVILCHLHNSLYSGTGKRYCLACGKEITQQRNFSWYCSEKYVGYNTAHSCRNKVSDTERTIRRKKAKFTSIGSLFTEEDTFSVDIVVAKYFPHLVPP